MFIEYYEDYRGMNSPADYGYNSYVMDDTYRQLVDDGVAAGGSFDSEASQDQDYILQNRLHTLQANSGMIQRIQTGACSVVSRSVLDTFSKISSAQMKTHTVQSGSGPVWRATDAAIQGPFARF